MRIAPLCLLLIACADTFTSAPLRDDPLATRVFAPDEADAMVQVANTATLAELDDDVPLDARAAGNIVAERAVAPFETVEELDAVPYVGTSALEALRDYAERTGLLGEGGELGYDAEQVAGALRVANTASEHELDVDVALDSRAAANIVAERLASGPFETLAAVDAVPYVGAAALDALVAYGATSGPCLLLSEVIEGQGMNNKAIEIYNCGDAPVDLSAFGVCLVRNDDATCTLSDPLPAVDLEPGQVHTACRTVDGTFLDPHPTIVERCSTEMPGTLNFSGDDRIVIHELETDRVLDMLGRFGWAPSWEIWADVGLRRCNPQPWTDTGYYDTAAFFTEHPRGDLTDYGVAPALAGCP